MAAWRGSHHDLAMQEASAETVLGDFDDASFTQGAVTSRFFRQDGRFFVTTDGPDGTLADFEIGYTFGVYPLQQYLIALPDGRLQALGIAWDARPADQGGQRWFHLYPEQDLRAGEPLHWTGIDQTWNFMCAECHSTELRKNYDPATTATRPAGPRSMSPASPAMARAPLTSPGPSGSTAGCPGARAATTGSWSTSTSARASAGRSTPPPATPRAARRGAAPRSSRPAASAIRAAPASPKAGARASSCSRPTCRASCSPACSRPTARCRARSTTTPRSARARCSSRA